MARDHARIQCAIWDDGDWCALTVAAQHTYKMLASQKWLSYCGVMTYTPATLAELSADNTEAKVRRAVKALEAERYVLVDQRTHELLVRTYVRHDGVLDRVNMGKATAAALDRVMSERLREAVVIELAKVWHIRSDLAGWIGFKEASPETFGVVQSIGLGME